jgi:hypothetical protein
MDFPDDSAAMKIVCCCGIFHINFHHLLVFCRTDINHFHGAANQCSVINFGFTILKSLSTANKLPA